MKQFKTAVHNDLRGQMFRRKRQMADADAREFLRGHMTAHVGTVDANGWPYFVALVYVYEGGEVLYLHTGAHQGHFLTNVQHDTRICVEVSEIGPLHKGKLAYDRYCQFRLFTASPLTAGLVDGRGTSVPNISCTRNRIGLSPTFSVNSTHLGNILPHSCSFCGLSQVSQIKLRCIAWVTASSRLRVPSFSLAWCR